MDTLTLFSKNLNQRSLTPRWPLTPCLLRSHVWLYPRIIVSKSHDNTSMYVDTVINFAKYHIHTYTYYVHTTYYVQNEWSHSLLLNSVQARQKCKHPIRQVIRTEEILLNIQTDEFECSVLSHSALGRSMLLMLVAWHGLTGYVKLMISLWHHAWSQTTKPI